MNYINRFLEKAMAVIWIFLFLTSAIFLLSMIKIFILIFFVKPISAEIYNVLTNVFPMSMTSNKPIYEVVVSYKYELNGKVFNSGDRKRDASLIEIEKIKEKIKVGDSVTVKIIKFFPETSYFFDYKYRVWMHVFLFAIFGVVAILTFQSL